MANRFRSIGERSLEGVGSGWLWFLVWVLLGLAAAVGAIVLGPLLFLAPAAVAAFLVYAQGTGRSTPGLLSGAGGSLLLYAAWLRAHYVPHLSCLARTATEGPGCEVPNYAQFLPPIALGAALLISGIVLQIRRSSNAWPRSGRRTAERPS